MCSAGGFILPKNTNFQDCFLRAAIHARRGNCMHAHAQLQLPVPVAVPVAVLLSVDFRARTTMHVCACTAVEFYHVDFEQ